MTEGNLQVERRDYKGNWEIGGKSPISVDTGLGQTSGDLWEDALLWIVGFDKWWGGEVFIVGSLSLYQPQ